MALALRRRLSQDSSPQGLSASARRNAIWSEVVHPGQYTAFENIRINFHTEV